MNTATLPSYFDRHESLRGMLVLSLGLHGLLFVVSVGYTALGGRMGGGWGRNWGGGGATRVSAVSSLPGVPLPAPLLATRSTLATQNVGLYKSEPTAKAEPPSQAEEIPKFQQAVAPEKAVRVAKRLQKEPLETPQNAIPYGLGGKPSMAYSQFVNTAGEGSLGFGEGNFGERYGWYVAAVRNRISANWLLSTVSPSIVTAPRVYINFGIARDGTVTDVRVVQSSGIPQVDRSALRAVLASNPLGPLPADYSGGKISVDFYFDFRRR
ncbi:MAG: TonB C-terminal domain-containing protein [Acidobacteriia bacterium]|jgi:protein TonB|nr:TonB C-terminal domain-containing protein [Terriglobia bacterium]